MGKDKVESSIKRFLKRKVKITLGLMIAFMITGTVGYAEDMEIKTTWNGERHYYISIPDENTGICVGGGKQASRNNRFFANGDTVYKYDGNKLKVEYSFVKEDNGSYYTFDEKGQKEIEKNGDLIIGGQISVRSNLKDDKTRFGKLILNASEHNIVINTKEEKDFYARESAAIDISNNGYAEIFAKNMTLNNNFSYNASGIKLKSDTGEKLYSGLKIDLTGKFTIKNFYYGILVNQSCNIENITAENMEISFEGDKKGYTGIQLGQTSTDKEGKSNISEINLNVNNDFLISNYKNAVEINNYNAKLSLNSNNNINFENGEKGIFLRTFLNDIPNNEELSENNIIAKNNINIKNYNIGIHNVDGKISLTAIESINIISENINEVGIKNDESVHQKDTYTKLNAKNIIIQNYKTGISNTYGEIIGLNKKGQKDIELIADNIEISKVVNGIYSENENSSVLLKSNYNKIISEKIALETKSSGKIDIIGQSEIKGDIKASSSGNITIDGKNNFINSSEITATSKGKIELDLTNGTLVGKIDDNRTNSFVGTGTINLKLDNGEWQSKEKNFVTTVNLVNNGKVKFTDEASSIDIATLTGKGNGTFVMNINSENKEKGNMLYIQNSEGGKYTINLQNSDLSKIKVGDTIRFATIGENAKNNNLEFKAMDIKERGIKNVSFKVENDDFVVGEEENKIYNDGENKSGNEYVENNYANGENWYITRTENTEDTNDIGTTIIEMSKANYAGAVYMDNLNKRLGDMTFADGDEGLWVRLRNDRVGEDNEYRLINYMTQLGYMKKSYDENGTTYRGIAGEITRGDMEFKNITGDATIDRHSISLYDTKLYNNGFYHDYVARVGRLENDFDIQGRETGNKAEGNYKNLFVGVSAEYGYRHNINNNWYVEPQGQLQYTYIDDTDYTTNQDTKVKLEDIHSLIGRVGFRLGYNRYSEDKKISTFYVKADVNHEFAGDQKVEAKDKTGSINKKYDNSKTWYDVGVGITSKVNESMDVYADIEKQFGSERDSKSWQFNMGFKYKF